MRKFLYPAALAAMLVLSPAVVAQDPPATSETIAEDVVATNAPVVATAGDTVVVTDDAIVTIPYGQILDDLLELVQGVLGALVLAVIGWAGRYLPGQLVAFLRTLRAEQLLTRAVDYGISATRGAVRGKSLDVSVGSAALANALNYAVQQASPSMVDWLGGKDAIRRMILARLDIDQDTSSSELGVPPPRQA